MTQRGTLNLVVAAIRCGWQWATSSRGVVLLMSLIMGAITWTTLVDDRLSGLPMRPVLVFLSTIAFVVGLGVGVHGRTPESVGWVGLTWIGFCLIRAGAWAVGGSWTGVVAWMPGLLLGTTVFARRRQHVDRQEGEDDAR